MQGVDEFDVERAIFRVPGSSRQIDRRYHIGVHVDLARRVLNDRMRTRAMTGKHWRSSVCCRGAVVYPGEAMHLHALDLLDELPLLEVLERFRHEVLMQVCPRLEGSRPHSCKTNGEGVVS